MLDEVIKVINNHLEVDPVSLSADTVLLRDLNVSSYALITLIVRFEEKYDIYIDEREIRKIRTVQDIADTLIANGAVARE